MGGVQNNPVKVTFGYMENGKQVTKDIYVQPGITINFSGDDKNENGTYTVGDTFVSNGKDHIAVINSTKDQVNALMGISQTNNSDNLKNDPKAYVLTDADVFSAMQDGGEMAAFKIVQRLDYVGSEKSTNDFNTRSSKTSGNVSTRLEAPNKSSDYAYVTVSSESTQKAAEEENKRLDKAYAEKHPIWNFFGRSRESYESSNKRDYQ